MPKMKYVSDSLNVKKLWQWLKGGFCHKVTEPQTDRQTEQKVEAKEFRSGDIKMVYIFRTSLIKNKIGISFPICHLGIKLIS